MSQEERIVPSSATPEAVPEAHQASRSSTTAVVRTIEDVERDIQKASLDFEQAKQEVRNARSHYEAALAASRKDPTNKDLSKDAEASRELLDDYKSSAADSKWSLERLDAELARLQVAASAPSGQKGKFSFCVFFVHTIVCLEGFRVGLRFRQSFFLLT